MFEFDCIDCDIQQELHKIYAGYDAIVDSALVNSKSYVFFDLGFTPQQQNIFEQMVVNNTSEYNNFDNLNNLPDEAKSFFEKIGNTPSFSNDAAEVIYSISNNVLKVLGAESAWITIRTFTTTSIYDMPRWHSDGYYFAPYDSPQFKIAINLKGSGTLFCDLPQEQRSHFNELQSHYSNDPIKTREELSSFISSFPTTSSQRPMGAYFVVGDQQNAAVHSEPPIPSTRIFMSIVAGTKQQIK